MLLPHEVKMSRSPQRNKILTNIDIQMGTFKMQDTNRNIMRKVVMGYSQIFFFDDE